MERQEESIGLSNGCGRRLEWGQLSFMGANADVKTEGEASFLSTWEGKKVRCGSGGGEVREDNRALADLPS